MPAGSGGLSLKSLLAPGEIVRRQMLYVKAIHHSLVAFRQPGTQYGLGGPPAVKQAISPSPSEVRPTKMVTRFDG
ncbi:hypothetical protein [Corynebacterium glutamicum]|uniref:hypothetical protein n=1 Tax=Corynebacterium glutamicum TaxID=1718 RepID=UPI0003F6061E|nr:hypothetical protein [Corynebacterium glutamicum]NII97934.1 hypothetical protein [Corynebacterium glutamicum]WBG74990.1 hypothetical protein O5J82_01865 [Corynebacterium glutamicum]